MSNQAVTPKFRMAFPNLMRPTKNLNDKEEWSVSALFPIDADLSALKEAAKVACAEKWGKDESKWPDNISSPFSDGNTKGKIDSEGVFQVYNGYKDTIVCNFKRNVKTKKGEEMRAPQVVMANPQIFAKEDDVYGGRWAKAVVNAYAWTYAGKNGVSFGLNHVQLLDHDTPFAPASSPQSMFDNEENSAEQPAAKSFLD